MPKWYRNGIPTFWLRFRNRVEEIVNFLTHHKFPKVLEPDIIGIIDATDVYNILKDSDVKHVFLSDEKYQVTNYPSMARFLAQDDTDKAKYVPIWHDCDDFSYRLMGQMHRGKWACLAFGIAWSHEHAFNVVILREFKVDRYMLYIIEPQTDRLFPADKAGKSYKPMYMVIM